MQATARVFLAVGSNLGDRVKNLARAVSQLKQAHGIEFVRASNTYETEPVGGPSQGKYLNAVWEIRTHLSPHNLLQMLLMIETSLGRERQGRNFPRTLDLDILFYDQKIIHEQGLVIPHPRLHERAFVLNPLCDLAPDWIHPEFQKTIQTLLEDLLENHPKS